MQRPRRILQLVSLVAAFVLPATAARTSLGQNFAYEAKPRAGTTGLNYSSAAPAPTMMEPAQEIGREQPRNRYLDPRYAGRAVGWTDRESWRWANRNAESRVTSRHSQAEEIGPGTPADPFVEMPQGSEPLGQGPGGYIPPRNYVPNNSALPPGSWADNGPPTDAPMMDGYNEEGVWSDEMGEGYEVPYAGAEPKPAFMHETRLFPFICEWLRTPSDPTAWGRNLQVIGGAQGFKGSPDMGQNGNFGFHKGLNWGVPVFDYYGIGGQLGGAVAFSDFNGSTGIVNSSRTQFFVTGGLFRRAKCDQGFQGGAVVDYLNDNFYVTMNLMQIRAEAGYIWHHHELGIWAAAHTKCDTQPAPATFGVPSVTWQATDQYNLYYRGHYSYGTTARSWIGMSGTGDFLWGADAVISLNQHWGFQAEYNYLLPRGNSNIPSAITETWGMTIGFVWYPSCRRSPECFDPYRPMFTVANNSSLLIRSKSE